MIVTMYAVSLIRVYENDDSQHGHSKGESVGKESVQYPYVAHVLGKDLTHAGSLGPAAALEDKGPAAPNVVWKVVGVAIERENVHTDLDMPF